MPAGTMVAVSFITETFIQTNIITTTDFPARSQLKSSRPFVFGFETRIISSKLIASATPAAESKYDFLNGVQKLVLKTG